MAPPPTTVSSHNHGAYDTDQGLRQVVIVRYASADYAVIDELATPQDDDHDERFVESSLVSFPEAQAVAVDYTENARLERRPLVGTL